MTQVGKELKKISTVKISSWSSSIVRCEAAAAMRCDAMRSLQRSSAYAPTPPEDAAKLSIFSSTSCICKGFATQPHYAERKAYNKGLPYHESNLSLNGINKINYSPINILLICRKNYSVKVWYLFIYFKLS